MPLTQIPWPEQSGSKQSTIVSNAIAQGAMSGTKHEESHDGNGRNGSWFNQRLASEADEAKRGKEQRT